MTESYRGRCFCKAVTFEIDPPVLSCVTCHCESCRRQCSAPMTTYIGVPDAQWRWTGEAPKIYNSSPGVERTFCGNCGTPLSFRSQRMSGVMHLYLAALDDPEVLEPKLHVAHEEKLCWLNLADDLPKQNGPEYL
ncbi:MAG: GFA family protein [Pseudomonadota bacterium]